MGKNLKGKELGLGIAKEKMATMLEDIRINMGDVFKNYS
jgi:hypothetical protein